MEPIKIAVSTKEPGFARALARGLAEYGEGLYIRILEADPDMTAAGLHGPGQDGTAPPASADWDVLVTDLDLSAPDGWKDRIVKLESYAISVKQVMDAVMEAAYTAGRCTGRRRQPETADGRRSVIIGFYGRYGSSGVTSIALTVGRMLAGAFGEKVLYLSFAPVDDAVLYGAVPYGAALYDAALYDAALDGEGAAVGPEEPVAAGEAGRDRRRSRKELLYRLRQEAPFYFQQYIEEDEYGLHCLHPCDGENCFSAMEIQERRQVLDRISAAAGYNVIIADLGKRPEGNEFAETGCDLSVEVRNRLDRRWALQERRKEPYSRWVDHVTIWNRNEENCGMEKKDPERCRTEDDLEKNPLIEFEIEDDTESFQIFTYAAGGYEEVESSGFISISMTKGFAMGIKNFADFLEENVLKVK